MVTIAATTSIGSGIRYSLLAPGDGAFVPVGNTVMSTDSTAISALVDMATITIGGSVFGDVRGIDIGGSTTTSQGGLVRVLTGGVVAATQTTSGAGIRVQSSNAQVYNEGSITGGYGVLIGGSQGGTNTVTNMGTISGDVFAVRQFSTTTDTLVLWNYGNVIGQKETSLSFSGEAAPGASAIIHNRGLMQGDINTGDGADTVDNLGGLIDGDVFLGSGVDVYNGAGGTVNGTVYGEADNDTFFVGTGADSYDGGSGADYLDFGKTGATQLALDDSIDFSGSSAGDTYTGFEHVYGSAFDDVIYGSAGANLLVGRAGNDTINGGAGGDTLRGGTGIDALTGGLGNDRFQYLALADCGDTITDFNNVTDDDAFYISAAKFGGGLVAGTLAANQFRSRADNAAQDADDRFIFRTTDKTLWYDADGNGAGAAIMVADLNADASLTNLDIVII